MTALSPGDFFTSKYSLSVSDSSYSVPSDSFMLLSTRLSLSPRTIDISIVSLPSYPFQTSRIQTVNGIAEIVAVAVNDIIAVELLAEKV